MDVILIEQWYALECFSPHLKGRYKFEGNVHGHPRFEDGHSVWTSPIEYFDGKHFITKSGSRYILGDPGEGETKTIQDLLDILANDDRLM